MYIKQRRCGLFFFFVVLRENTISLRTMYWIPVFALTMLIQVYCTASKVCETLAGAQRYTKNLSLTRIDDFPLAPPNDFDLHPSLCFPSPRRSRRMKDNASCRWNYNITKDDNRIPKNLLNATLKNCGNKTQTYCLKFTNLNTIKFDSHAICAPLKLKIPVYRRKNACYVPELEEITVAFGCTRLPQSKATSQGQRLLRLSKLILK